MRSAVAGISEKAALVQRGGPDEARERHVSRGKLLPRDRVTRLLDEGSPIEYPPRPCFCHEYHWP